MTTTMMMMVAWIAPMKLSTERSNRAQIRIHFSRFPITSKRCMDPVAMFADRTATWSGLRLPRISSVHQRGNSIPVLLHAHPASIVIIRLMVFISIVVERPQPAGNHEFRLIRASTTQSDDLSQISGFAQYPIMPRRRAYKTPITGVEIELNLVHVWWAARDAPCVRWRHRD